MAEKGDATQEVMFVSTGCEMLAWRDGKNLDIEMFDAVRWDAACDFVIFALETSEDNEMDS